MAFWCCSWLSIAFVMRGVLAFMFRCFWFSSTVIATIPLFLRPHVRCASSSAPASFRRRSVSSSSGLLPFPFLFLWGCIRLNMNPFAGLHRHSIGVLASSCFWLFPFAFSFPFPLGLLFWWSCDGVLSELLAAFMGRLLS